MSNALIETIRKRRSQYNLVKELPIDRAAVEGVIKEAVRLTPSSFNSQSTRAVILFGSESDVFWDLTKEALRPMVPADSFATTEKKLDGFAAGAGTILFYYDEDVVKSLQDKFKLYADNFPVWAEQANGMAQFAVWSALAEANIGASLQHYNPVVDALVAKRFDIPDSWRLRAQMPFGGHGAGFEEKSFIDDDVRFKVFG